MGKCYFRSEWLRDDRFSNWLVSDSDNSKFSCKVCKQTYTIGFSGLKALTAHMATGKHLKSMSAFKSTSTLNFGTKSKCVKEIRAPEIGITDSQSQVKIDSFSSQDQSLRAEIKWVLHVISTHGSARSSVDIGELFRDMFHDSTIAKSFKCSRTKLSYLASFGIAPVLKDRLLEDIKNAACHVLLFDESLNPDLQKKQLDVHFRFMDCDGLVKTKYMDSYFLGRASASDILKHLLLSLDVVGSHKLLQLSMDGPNVNIRVQKDLCSKLQEDHEVKLLNIGSCGLHVVHNSFKSGATDSGWNIAGFLKACYYVFKDSPARKEDFLKISDGSLLPLKFCGHRWLENISVVERVLLLLPNILKFISEQKKLEARAPSCSSFKTLLEFENDKLLPAKLYSFLFIARILRPFLLKYQKHEPLAPFIFGDLFDIVKRLYSLILKSDYVSTLKHSNLPPPKDIDECHFKKHNQIDVGFQAEGILEKERKKLSEYKIMDFRMSFRKFVSACLAKLLSKTPLAYKTARDLACLDPVAMTSTDTMPLFKSLIRQLNQCNRIPDDNVDEIAHQYGKLVEEVKKSMPFYSSSVRLDEFYKGIAGLKEMPELKKVIDMVLILSHGNADVERGFSVNKEVTVENLMEESLVSRRLICQYVQDNANGRVVDVVVNKDMLASCSKAWHRYNLALEDKRKKEKDSQENMFKKRKMEELGEMKCKKRKLELDIEGLIHGADDLIEKAEDAPPKAAHELIVRSNALRRESKSKKETLANLSSEVLRKEEELKSL